MTSSALERPRAASTLSAVRTRARGIPPRYESSGAVLHSFEQRDLRFVRVAFEFHVESVETRRDPRVRFPSSSLFLSRADYLSRISVARDKL